MAENEHEKTQDDTGTKPKPGRQKKRPEVVSLTPRQKRIRKLFQRYSPWLVTAAPVAQAIWGYFSGYWKETWFIVIFLAAIFLIVCFGCWWFGWKALRSFGVIALSSALLSGVGWCWHWQVAELDSFGGILSV